MAVQSVTAAILAAAITLPPVYVVPANRTGGGHVLSYIDHVERLDAAGYRVVIDTPSCSSACTLYLTARDVCVSERTLFRFHGPMALGGAVFTAFLLQPPSHGMRSDRHTAWVALMSEAYDRWPGLGDWFADRAGESYGMRYVTLRGQTLHDAFGVPLCEE